MNKPNLLNLTFFILTAAFLSSCGSSYSIKGTSDISILDGRCFLLQTFKDNDMVTIDSCEVVHGQFTFTGAIDSVKLAYVVNEAGILPLILEEGNILIKLSAAEESVTGTALNEQFSDFRKQLMLIDSDIQELSRKDSQGIMNGEDMDSLTVVLQQEYETLLIRRDSLATKFICNNFENPLAAAAFQYLTATTYEVPELSPWVEDILSKANDTFKNDPYVKGYVEHARYREGVMNGTVELPNTEASAAIQTPPTESGDTQENPDNTPDK